MAKNFHNGTNIFAKHDTIFLGEDMYEFFVAAIVKHTLISWHRRFQPFNLEPKIHLASLRVPNPGRYYSGHFGSAGVVHWKNWLLQILDNNPCFVSI